MRRYIESLESRLLLSSIVDALAADRAHLAADMAKFGPTLSADRKAVADEMAVRASADHSLITQLKADLAPLAGKLKADRQSLLTARAADLMLLRADRGDPGVFAADRQKLQADTTNLLAVFKQDMADRAAMVNQARAAIAVSNAAAGGLIKQAMAKLASDRAIAAPIISADMMQLSNDEAMLLPPMSMMSDGGGGMMGSGGMQLPSSGSGQTGAAGQMFGGGGGAGSGAPGGSSNSGLGGSSMGSGMGMGMGTGMGMGMGMG